MRRLLLSAIFVVALTGAAQAQQSASACLYESRSYSEGAYVCVARSLMQACTSDAGRLMWKMVDDPAINGACPARERPRSRWRHSHRRHAANQIEKVNRQNSAKCFQFNGKKYCE